ncbi:hypothetical protein MKW98_027328 [Papaver atlanticum]|uniref:Methyltransferase-like protein 13 n=1 Tax=Papaver atlanticum TaxID=357466 RepID=A0AAD4XIM3_9MAGN|nr:hypothetical protein MKW98_027328 [Papaver atlanticum]
MAMDKGTFENLNPSQYISFDFPNPHHSKESTTISSTYGNFLRITVLDSPIIQTSDDYPTQIAAMLVPIDREDDWIFSTKDGNFQLLSNLQQISRLILVGNLPCGDFPVNYYRRPILDGDREYMVEFEEALLPLLIAVSPKSYLKGEMIVEDVEMENSVDDKLGLVRKEFRRRLRFKRMPNLVQTEMRIVPDRIEVDSVNYRIGEMEFKPDIGCLVHPYLAPMVASLSLIARNLDNKYVCSDSKLPKVLCVGIGGGALLTFLRTQFGFQVFGVENDEMVVNVAKRYFGLVESEFLRVLVGDGIDVIRRVARRGVQAGFVASITNADLESDQHSTIYVEDESKFDIIMVDLDSNDAMNGPGAPPLDFVQNLILLDAKLALNTLGILVVNVIPLSKSFYEVLICELRKIFSQLYEINVGNEENYVIIAAVSPVSFVHDEIETSIQENDIKYTWCWWSFFINWANSYQAFPHYNIESVEEVGIRLTLGWSLCSTWCGLSYKCYLVFVYSISFHFLIVFSFVYRQGTGEIKRRNDLMSGHEGEATGGEGQICLRESDLTVKACG